MAHKNNQRRIARREFVAGATMAAAALLPGRRALGKSSPPNVLLFIADNLGWKDLSCYGDPNLETPNIDRLAGEGARFTNAFVTAPSCSPSRASIISGQAPHSVNVLGLTHLYPQYQMPEFTRTLPHSLMYEGYATAINGKWHVAPYRPTSWYGYSQHMGTFSIKSSDPARKFISDNRDRPFYLEMNFMQTHRPSMTGRGHGYRQDPDFPKDPDKIQIPDYYSLPDWPEIREDLAGYYSQAESMDRLIGEVLAHLKSLGLRENTLVIFVSDNGPMYPEGIGHCYDFGIATPLIMRWPDGLPAGKTVEGLASTIDIMPTCMEAAGISSSGEVQGKSLLDAARGEAGNVHDAVFAEMTYHVRHTIMRAIRTSEYKYIENLNDTPVGLDMCKNFGWAKKVAQLPGQRCCVPRPPEELFDLAKDPREKDNLADDPEYSQIKGELRSRLHEWRTNTRDPLPI